MMTRPNALFLLDSTAHAAVYAPSAASAIAQRVDVLGPPLTAQSIAAQRSLLSDVDVLFSGWGCPRMDGDFLDAAPNLKAVFYAAGAIRGWATPAVFARGVRVTTANAANAVPVAEYTVATTLFSLKHGWRLMNRDGLPAFDIRPDVPGAYRSTVGLVGLGTVARIVVTLLASYDVRVLACDPHLSTAEALRLGVEGVTLERLFTDSDVVSLHAPDLPSTRGLVDERLILSMKPNATLINTSRGRLIREGELIDALRRRPDLQAVLDVTQHEPPPVDAPLRQLPNVVLTPHIAGSQGQECQRMGQCMVDELDRYLAGRPLRWQVDPAEAMHSVHRLRA